MGMGILSGGELSAVPRDNLYPMRPLRLTSKGWICHDAMHRWLSHAAWLDHHRRDEREMKRTKRESHFITAVT